MKLYSEWKQLPPMKTFNGRAFRILRANERNPNKRTVIEIPSPVARSCPVRQKLTLNRVEDTEGLMSFLADIGVVERTAMKRKAVHYLSLYRRVERYVQMWKREDEEGHESKELIVDSRDLEEFVREVLKHQICILRYIGFPFGEGDNCLGREFVMREYESQSTKDGFLPADKILDFLRKVSRADMGDGAAGRLWKAEMVMLMQHLKICGYVGKVSRQAKGKKAEEVDIADEGLPEMARQEWPPWMEKAWHNVAPPIAETRARPFLPRTLIYKFIKEIAFSREENVRNFKESHATVYASLKVIDEEYDSWKKDPWNEKRSSARHGDDEIEGLLSVDYLHIWMQKNIVEKTSEVSLHIFKEALKMAEFTLPPSSVEALWYSADKAQMAGNKAQERASLRQVKDLEDRLVTLRRHLARAEDTEPYCRCLLVVGKTQRDSGLVGNCYEYKW
eukprot:g22311.t1